MSGPISKACWIALGAGVVALPAYADGLPLPSSGVAQITEDRWRAVLTDVQSTPGVECQTISHATIYVCIQKRGNVIWTFAMEGSPAFPAVSQSLLMPRLFCEPGYSGPKVTINRSAGYAGNHAAFQKFLEKLISTDQKFLAKQLQCSSSATDEPKG